MTRKTAGLHLGVALTGAGWHPGAWRAAHARPAELLTAQYWADLVRKAESGLLDFVTFEDRFTVFDRGVPDDSTDLVAGQLDSVLVASRVAPLTRHIGLIPTAVVTHTEPFHLSKAIATLDYVSGGRAGVRLRVSGDPREAALFGRRRVDDQHAGELLDEAADYATALGLLWDSWEDDAEIRDNTTGRFIDRDKLHYADFAGEFFSVRGPSITPRPPQGRPPIAALAHSGRAHRFVGASADLGFITPDDENTAAAIVADITGDRHDDAPVRLVVDLAVTIGDTDADAHRRADELNSLSAQPYSSDAEIVVGSASTVADRIAQWASLDGIDGVRLRPAALPDDLTAITRSVVPILQGRGLFRKSYAESTLRGRLGLSRPANLFTERVSAS
ncbi:LLM class flavin-dependent oxidoreductase [Gordonia amarae]|uniref:LLM class flavin-dependent oxidoreductase n=2 Tax=Gordonia amarae TaxID=36821 RepID=A0A857MBU0_9ACTN|nr:LLM class flavin-dependent oxidoreductase [Gordonia amarae]MCS3878077.1 alkanesulfonate monooxygenase SsuD/methylene tetrahydromethanopterin reductase-like flavin-dependent oxidoreductase (luciferase family) [Gordonia amarae]QHN16763.1 LLM class flavin-dependent oxidoreductase [Gordonia amarae]QHN21288.1 LLM class flavin-dependent oxidoreductase [Gordonia amarae]QHN30142.1 LLM class flavin-dependent oxidoreductase [Gordonia amarae]QHN38915.1 LLM class flavin-dependent oxidoreductase [Gordon